jgi:hypothetical protein
MAGFGSRPFIPIMDCLKNYIGLKGYKVTVAEGDPPYPESGLHINALPGITTDILLKIAESEDIETDDVVEGAPVEVINRAWDNIQQVAGRRLYTDSIARLKTGYNLCYKLEGDSLTAPIDEDKKYEAVICSNKKLFASAWLYLLGNQCCVELLGSSNSNQHTTVDFEKYKELRDYYQVEYEKQLKIILDSLCIESNKISSGGNVKVVTWLP